MRRRAFRSGAIRPRMPGGRTNRAMTTDPAPSVRQLLAFYLEAGVDCALTDEPVTGLSDPDIIPISGSREPAPPNPVRPIPATIPVARGETTPAPEAAIVSAREAARTAPSLEVLRALLENFDGCALKSTATRLVFADGNPRSEEHTSQLQSHLNLECRLLLQKKKKTQHDTPTL